MAATVALVLALLAAQIGVKTHQHIDVATEDRMHQHEELLEQEMTRLQREIEQSTAAEEALLLIERQTFAGALVLFPVLFWLTSRRKSDSESGREQHGPNREAEEAKEEEAREEEEREEEEKKEEEREEEEREEEEREEEAKEEEEWEEEEWEEEEWEEEAREEEEKKEEAKEEEEREEEEREEQVEEELSLAHNGITALTPSPRQDPPDMRKVLKELVADLLGACRVLSKMSLMPEMHPASETDGSHESWSIHEDSITYRLLVVLQPPPGHSFCLETDTAGQMPARPSSIRVLEECMCWKDKLLGHHVCFLHPVNDQQSSDSSSLLPTICSGSYLDVEKMACWVQQLVPAAWKYLPQSHSIQLKVLPSSRSCRFQLTDLPSMNICLELTFAVHQGSSGAYLSIE